MKNQPKPPYALHLTLWIVQLVLASSLLWAVAMKWFQSIEKLALMWPWAGQVPASLVTFTGAVDLLGALGLILPAWLRIKPHLTPLAAAGICLLMICASIFHIVRGEASLIGVNIGFALMAVFVAWGRWIPAPIAAK